MNGKQIDETVIAMINAGSEKAFSMLYKAYYVYLNTICFYWLNDKDACREVVNDAFLQIWNRRETLSFPIHGYLVKTVQNGSIDYLRTRQSRIRMLKGHTEQFTQSYQENYIRATPEPLQYVEVRQAEEEIRKTLEQLPPRCREIFVAYFYEGKSVKEIAESTNLTVSTVRVQLKNALDRLRKQLEYLLPLLIFFA